MQNSKKSVYVVTAVVLIVIVAIFSGANNGKGGDRKSGPIRVGVISPFSGIVASYGEEVKKGVQSVDAPGVEFIFEDDQCDPKTAISAFKKLTDFDKVNYIIGPGCGSPQSAIAPLLVGQKKIAIVPSAASRDLYSMSGNNLYNMQYSLEDEASFIAEEMYARGYKNVALISYQNDFSRVEVDSFKKNFKGKIVHEIIYNDGTSDIQTELTKIKNGKFDAIFNVDISFYFAGGLQKMRNLGINVPVFSPYPTELPVVRSLVEGVYYSFPKDVNDGRGGVYGISKQSTELLVSALNKCGDDYGCVKSFIDASGFDMTGVKQRSLIIKQIKGGEAVVGKGPSTE